MDDCKLRILKGFYENELRQNLLSFWLPQCVDVEHGGFYNCFDNAGKKLVSRDKYTWSQGRFVWIWAKLADMQSDTFTKAEKERFLALAKNGIDFLQKHCLLNDDDWRCAFLMDECGNHKYVDHCKELDMSIYADCFVVSAFAKYAQVSSDCVSWNFSKNLYLSILKRISSGNFHTLPYPLSSGYKQHGLPMILSNISCEMYGAAQKLEPHFCAKTLSVLEDACADILNHFVDEKYVLHEIITQNNEFINNLFGQHVNPGHVIEDMWFMIYAMDILNKPEMLPQIRRIAQKTFEIGWDKKFGGIYHYTNVNGGELSGDSGDALQEPMMQLALSDWGSKLWWVHSEALYTSLLLYQKTKDEMFLQWHYKVAEYTFETFPSRDTDVKEWVQIRARNGEPQDKVVALPVKDPYHIIRDIILIIELLDVMLKENKSNKTTP